MYVEMYTPHIGKKSALKEVYVTAAEIEAFANALGDKDPLYHDVEYAKSKGYENIIAPPTFNVTLICPMIDDVWVAPTGRIHAEEELVYYKPLVAEKKYFLQREFVDAYEKEGKNGVMVFTVFNLNVLDEKLEKVVTAIMTTVTKGAVFEAYKGNYVNTIGVEEKFGALVPKCRFEDLNAGYDLPEIVLPAYNRIDIAKYAAVAHDFNSIHLDDESAKKLNFKSVIAHGLLNMGLEGRAFTEWFGGRDYYSIKSMQIKFSTPAYVGDTPHLNAQVISKDEEQRTAGLDFKLTNQDGTRIVSGTTVLVFK